MKRAIVTVVGKDRVGIIYEVSKLLAERQINIMDISQTIRQEYFMMMMVVDISNQESAFGEIAEACQALGARLGVEIKIQREEIFHSMHRI